MRWALTRLCFIGWATAAMVVAADPYRELEARDAREGTKDEPFMRTLSLPDAAGFLDEGAHLVEHNCYACHSTFTYLAARSILDPLAPEVMKSRVMLERFNALMFDPQKVKLVKTHHVSRVRVLSAIELARHDAVTTGTLAPTTRRMLDHLWSYQTHEGGIDWIWVKEAPQAIDNYWPAMMMAVGVGVAPDGYAATDKAKAGLDKLRGWFKAHPPQTIHERGLVLISHAAMGGLLSEGEVRDHVAAIFAKQHSDGGWSMVDLAPWTRKDNKPLDPSLTDGYATGFLMVALAKAGVTRKDERLQRGIAWIKTHQRASGGWFTQSPFHRDRIATNTGTSWVVQALEACGEIVRPFVTAEQFAAAHEEAEKAVPVGVFLPDQDHPLLTAGASP
ncbi:MAG: terpene cyclase/mutase family protein [Verrucomicrobiaceae bacterium]|nr:terpene cyclase/mutase family protein [Verrucomicrobiaceae bacterium]